LKGLKIPQPKMLNKTTSRSQTKLEKAHIQQAKITWNSIELKYWLLGSKSQLSIENKLLLYKAILKSIRAYDVQLWDTVTNTNIKILQRFQNKYVRIIVNAPFINCQMYY